MLLRVEVPNALPLILGGLRTATLQIVATATVAAYASLGGLGRYLIDGIKVREFYLALVGALMVTALALILDAAAGLRGVARRSRAADRFAQNAAAVARRRGRARVRVERHDLDESISQGGYEARGPSPTVGMSEVVRSEPHEPGPRS